MHFVGATGTTANEEVAFGTRASFRGALDAKPTHPHPHLLVAERVHGAARHLQKVVGRDGVQVGEGDAHGHLA